MAASKLEIALWDTYVSIERQRNHSVRGKRLSDAGKLGLWRRWKKHHAVLAQIPIVKRIASTESRKFAPHLDLRDLVQSGMVGLLEASERYRPGRGGFPQYAYFRIRGAIIDANKRRPYREELHQSLDRRMGGGELDGVVTETFGERVADQSPPPIAGIIDRERALALRAAIRKLPAADRKLLRAWMEGRPIREQCAISGMGEKYTHLRIEQIQGRLRALLRPKQLRASA